MKVIYLSLRGCLDGYYVKFEAEHEDTVSCYAAQHFGDLAGNTYSEAYFMEILRKKYPKNTRVVNRDRTIVLLGDP